jgi:signal transduction histidine kinase
VRVFVTDSELTSGVATARLALVSLSVVLVAIAVLITDRLARAIVAPVEELSRASAELAAGNLEARVSPGGPPEITEVGQRFNRLAGEVAALLQAERETAADLSHRLRTPLTAARLDAEGIADGEARATMMADLDNIERSVDHAIELLRAPGRAVAAKSVLEEVVAERVAFWEPLAAEQDRTVSMRLPESRTVVAVAADDLIAAVDALIGNVFTHTPDGSEFMLTVEATPGFAAVRVEDAGPGFGDRSLAARGVSAAGSTGLGLDIARRTAELAGGAMTLGESPLGGASIQLTFALQ